VPWCTGAFTVGKTQRSSAAWSRAKPSSGRPSWNGRASCRT